MNEFIRRMFQSYYAEDFKLDSTYTELNKREFGFVLFSNKVIRHIKFEAYNELLDFLQKNAPIDVYYSCAYYENPTAEMERKNWLGADLIFDIDADHISTPCERIHDRWVCGSCGFVGKGVAPEKCPLCGGEKLSVETWPCEVCLEAAKFEVMKLLDVLQDDFGFSKSELRVFFSGHRGYHVHVECEAVKSLDSMARKEIVDYVCGLGLETSLLHVKEGSFKRRFPLETVKFFSFGWSRRLTEGLQTFLSGVKEDDLRKLGFRKGAVNAIIQRRDAILRALYNSRMGHTVRGVGFKTWEKLVKHVATLQSVKIDTVVTTDVHRLIRMPQTLNSKTGFKKADVPISTIDDFDPFKDAIAFKNGTAEVWISDAPKFRIGDETFGPYRNRKVELPMAAALLLVCRGRAEVVGNV